MDFCSHTSYVRAVRGAAGEIIIERELYEPTRLFANTYFLQKLREQITTVRLQAFVADTSQAPSADGGPWSRPCEVDELARH